MIEGIPVVQEWQLQRLLDHIYYNQPTVERKFPGLFFKMYLIRPEGIDWVEWAGRRYRVVKTMGKEDLKFDRDLFWIHPHRALQVDYKSKALTVGFWCENLDQFVDFIKEIIPDVDTSHYPEGKISGRVYVDRLVHAPTSELHNERPDADRGISRR